MAIDKKIRVGITQGDTNGIGYELILKTLGEPGFNELCTPVVYGSSRIASFYRKALEMEPVQFNCVTDAADIKHNVNNLVEVLPGEIKIEPGVESREAGHAALIALERATEDLREGKIDVLVTAPICKDSIQSPEFNFPGHTEYLEACIGNGRKPLMILFCGNLRVALVTTHLPLKDVPQQITKEAIIEKLNILNHTLAKDFGIDAPRIAVLSLNPHAGENGLLGTEEQEIITPAINEAYASKILCFGPYAADGFFGAEQYKHFDAVLAMYHDQGLAPFKTIAMDAGVNFTAGLPFVRTSPDHGTGFDIAGKGVASPVSFREAIYSAIDIFRTRMSYIHSHRNPLRRQYYDKSNDKETFDITKMDVETENTL